MEIITIECPKCKGELHVKEDTEKLFCMYCRAEVIVKAPEENPVQVETAGLESLVKRGFLSLEYSEWSKAEEVFDKAANIDPEHAPLYVGKLLSRLRLKKEAELQNHKRDLTRYNEYQKAIRFGDDALKKRLEAYNEQALRKEAEYEKEEAKRKKEEAERKEEQASWELLANIGYGLCVLLFLLYIFSS